MKRYDPCGHMAMDEATAPKYCPLCQPGKAKTKGISPKKARPDLNGIFKGQLIQYGVTGWKEEHYFHTRRKWRFDFAWPELKIAVEIHGGTYVPKHQLDERRQGAGAHSRGAHQRRDFEKWSEAAILGWRVLHGDTKDVRKSSLVEKVTRLLHQEQRRAEREATG